MSTTFTYARVSTFDQTTDNQRLEIQSADFAVVPHCIIVKSSSGSIATGERPSFAKLLNKLERNDVLVVTKLDRLGRNAMDMRAMVEHLGTIEVWIHRLRLGGVDPASASGKTTIGVLDAVAEFERDLPIECTQAGLARAKSDGTVLGRHPALNKPEQAEVLSKLAIGVSTTQLANDYNTARQSVMCARDRAMTRQGGEYA